MILSFTEFLQYVDLYESASLYGDDLNESNISPVRFKESALEDIIEFVDSIVYKTGTIDITEKVAGQHITVNIKGGFVTINTKDSLLHDTGDKNAAKTKYGADLTRPLIKYMQHNPLPDQSWSFEVVNPAANHDYIRYDHADSIYIEYTGNLSEEVAADLRKLLSARLLTKKDIRINIIENKAFQDFKQEWEYHLRKRFTNMRSDKKSDFYYRTINMLKYKIGELFEQILVSVVDKKSPVEGIVANTSTTPFKLQTNSFLSVQRVQMPVYSVFKVNKDEIGRILAEPLKSFQELKDQHGLSLTSIYKGDLKNSLYDVLKNYLQNNRKLKDIDTSKYRVWLTTDESDKMLSKLDRGNAREVYQELYSKVKQ